MSTGSPPHSSPRSQRREDRTAASSVRWQREVPETIRSLAAIADPDYADVVTASIETPLKSTPEDRVHAALVRSAATRAQ